MARYKATSHPPAFMAPLSESATPRHTTLLLSPTVCLLCACASPYLRCATHIDVHISTFIRSISCFRNSGCSLLQKVSFRSSAPLTTEALRDAAPLRQSPLLTLAPDWVVCWADTQGDGLGSACGVMTLNSSMRVVLGGQTACAVISLAGTVTRLVSVLRQKYL